MELSDQGRKLLGLLVAEIRSGRIVADHPETFAGYGEMIDKLQLPSDAPRGETDGQTLQLNGLNDLARWIKRQRGIPKITGLIVWKHGDEKDSPGGGYFREYGIRRDGKEYSWWLDEARKSIGFDWSPYLPAAEAFDSEAIRFVGSVSEGAKKEVPSKVRQRSEKLRDLARDHFSWKSADGKLHCAVCNWSKPAFPLSREIVEIHHADELGNLPEDGRTLSVAEAIALLAPLCPTCHRMLHAKPGGGSFTVAELRKYLNLDSER
jgi:hypothetical protein